MCWTRKATRFLAIATFVLTTFPGCAYLKDRGNDALDILDVGLTFSTKPHVAVYAGFQSVLGAGYADVEGKMLGIGNRKVGWLDMRYSAAGSLVEAREEWAYGDYEDDPELIQKQGVGLGLFYHGLPRTVPKALNCAKFVHVLFVGVNVNCKIGEVLDFILGWIPHDIGGDDVHLSRKEEATP